MDLKQLSYKNSTIGYYRFGSGTQIAFCFHGYGEEALLFEFLGKYAGTEFTFYAIDLPFHGKTIWQEGLNFSASDLLQIIVKVLEQHNDPFQSAFSDNIKFSLIGYSLGGRIALSLYECIPDKIEKLILLAPDRSEERRVG